MPYSIRVYNVEAQYHAGVWTCQDDPLLALLQSFIDPRDRHSNDPWVDLKHAHMVAERLGGTLLGGPYPQLAVEQEAQEPVIQAAQAPVVRGGFFGQIRAMLGLGA